MIFLCARWWKIFFKFFSKELRSWVINGAIFLFFLPRNEKACQLLQFSTLVPILKISLLVISLFHLNRRDSQFCILILEFNFFKLSKYANLEHLSWPKSKSRNSSILWSLKNTFPTSAYTDKTILHHVTNILFQYCAEDSHGLLQFLRRVWKTSVVQAAYFSWSLSFLQLVQHILQCWTHFFS